MTPASFAAWCAEHHDPEAALALVDAVASLLQQRDASLATQLIAFGFLIAEIDRHAVQRGLFAPALPLVVAASIDALDVPQMAP